MWSLLCHLVETPSSLQNQHLQANSALSQGVEKVRFASGSQGQQWEVPLHLYLLISEPT